MDKELLAQHSKGLVVLSACLSGEVAVNLLNGNTKNALKVAGEYREIFGSGNYFLEIQDHGLEDQIKINAQLLEMSSKLEIPLVATNDSHYINKEDHRAHDILLCIQRTARSMSKTECVLDRKVFTCIAGRDVTCFRICRKHYGSGRNRKALSYRFAQPGYHLPLFPVPEGLTLSDYLNTPSV